MIWVLLLVFCCFFLLDLLSLFPNGFLLCDHGLDLWDRLMCEFNQSINQPLLWWGATLCLQYPYYYVLVAEVTTAVNQSGKASQLLSNAWCYFAFFALCLLLFLALLAGRHSDSTPDNYCCLFPLLLWVFLWMYLLISAVLFLVERGTGKNEHGVVVEWISTCVWCLVTVCSSRYERSAQSFKIS